MRRRRYSLHSQGKQMPSTGSTELHKVQAFMASVWMDLKCRRDYSLLLEFLRAVIQIAECRKKLSCWDSSLFQKLKLFNSALIA